MKKDTAKRKEYFEKMELLNDEGKAWIYKQIDLCLDVDYMRADYKPQNAQVVNFESKRP